MPNYDELLGEVRKKAEAFFRLSANEYVPKMYWALRNENPNITPEDARERIEKDCTDMWKKRTILDALPDEAKDPEKQKSGRSRQKEQNSAAVSAAPIKKKEEIVIDIEGKPADNFIPQLTGSLSTLSQSSNSDNQLQNNNLLPFEFSLRVQDVLGYLFPDSLKRYHNEDRVWFSGVLDKSTGEVISAAIRRKRTSLDSDICDGNTDYDYDR